MTPHEWFGEVRFPARIRWFVDEAAAPAEIDCDGIDNEGPHAPSAVQLAAACGSAWAEAERGGQVVAVVGADAMNEGLFIEALDLAARLRLPLTAVISGAVEDQHVALLREHAWQITTSGLGHSQGNFGVGPRAVILGAQPQVDRNWRTDLRREWPPVRIAALPPIANADELDTFCAQHRHIFPVHCDEKWRAAPDTQAKLLAAAQLAAEGRRVIWKLPEEVDVMPWLHALRDIGERGLGIKLLCAPRQLPALSLWHAIPGWWICGPRDAREFSEVVHHALDSEDPMLVAYGGASAPAMTVTDSYHVPGSGRWLAPIASCNLICDQSTWQLALDARAELGSQGIDVGIFHCLSLLPLPAHDLGLAARRDKMVVLDHAESARGLGGAIRATVDDTRECICIGGRDGIPPSVADIVASVRAPAHRRNS
jgi:hypothetical protein